MKKKALADIFAMIVSAAIIASISHPVWAGVALTVVIIAGYSSLSFIFKVMLSQLK